MAESDIPVDLFNPGQVFACLGFLEAADILLGDAEGGFDWRDKGDARFRLRAKDDKNPFAVVLTFLAEAEIKRFGPVGYGDPPPKKVKEGAGQHDSDEDDEPDSRSEANGPVIDLSETFCSGKGDRMALPIRISGGNQRIVELDHWADGSSRETFKLYSGNRSADSIARAMLKGGRKKPSKRQRQNNQPGDLKSRGLTQLWDEDHIKLTEDPLNVLTPIGGSFNFDPRGTWTAIDAGYSPNDQKPKHAVEASPVVEFLAAWGLEHARPELFGNRQVRYATWGVVLSPILARVSLAGSIPSLPIRRFHFVLGSSGKNKIVTFAEEDI
jgi:CRISPR-associated protein Csx14